MATKTNNKKPKKKKTTNKPKQTITNQKQTKQPNNKPKQTITNQNNNKQQTKTNKTTKAKQIRLGYRGFWLVKVGSNMFACMTYKLEYPTDLVFHLMSKINLTFHFTTCLVTSKHPPPHTHVCRQCQGGVHASNTCGFECPSNGLCPRSRMRHIPNS